MKHIVRAAAFLACITLICHSALAAGELYTFDELELSVTTPEGFIAISRDISPNDMALEALGIDYDALIDSFIKNRVYLNATRFEPHAEINVALWQDAFSIDAENFAKLSHEKLISRAQEYIDLSAASEDAGFSLTRYSLYKTANEVYLVFDIVNNPGNESISGRQYQTVYGGKCVTFTIITRTEGLSESDASILRAMVDNCVFGNEGSKGIPAWANILLVLGMLVIGASTMVAAQKRAKKLENERNEKRKKRALSKPRPAYCPNCGAQLEDGHTFCLHCGEWKDGKPG